MKIVEQIHLKINSSQNNNYTNDNYDENRFGPYKNSFIKNTLASIKTGIKKILFYDSKKILLKYYEDRLQKLYDILNENDRAILIDIITFRLVGYKKFKLRNNNKSYWETIEKTKNTIDYKSKLNNFLNFNKVNLSLFNYDINFFYKGIGFVNIFCFEQYTKKDNNKLLVSVEKGDTVLDIGAMVGDTSLYFANKTTSSGKVYSFEFTPSNIEIFKLNAKLNPNLCDVMEIIERPVSDISDVKIYFTDKGEGSEIKFEPFDNFEHTNLTISIDDFVKERNISKVDFIKMDIEGAEPLALNGALETIKKFKPKLAIAIYHSWDDFVNIPLWIHDLNLGYNIYLDHYTIHTDETIIFASVN